MVGYLYGSVGLFFPGLVLESAGVEIDVPMIQKWAPRLAEWQDFLEFLMNSSHPENLDLYCPGVATYFAKLHMCNGLAWKVRSFRSADGSVDSDLAIANWMRLAAI